MGRNNLLIYVTILLMMVSGCKNFDTHQKDIVVAEAAGKVLYKSEIKNYPITFVDQADSLAYVKDFITQWIKQQLLVAEAEKQLSNEKKDIDKELEKYRQELLIHTFRNRRISAITDNEIKETEIENFYNENIRLFTLDRIIVRVTYIVFPKELEIPNSFKRQLSSNNESDVAANEDFIYSYATKYDDFNNNWIYFETFLQSIKYEIENLDRFLTQNKLIEFSTETEYHIIDIKAFHLAGDNAPLEFVAPRIRSLIINSKKLDFLREIKDSLYNNALKYNKFRVFNQ